VLGLALALEWVRRFPLDDDNDTWPEATAAAAPEFKGDDEWDCCCCCCCRGGVEGGSNSIFLLPLIAHSMRQISMMMQNSLNFFKWGFF
jgi:hypothetical protein